MYSATPTNTITNTMTSPNSATPTETITPTETSTCTTTPSPTPTITPTFTPSPSSTITLTFTPFPQGPAYITAKMSEITVCTPWETGCVWYYKIVFSETRGVLATITNICRRYRDRKGVYWMGMDVCDDVSFQIPGIGEYKYSGWVRTRAESPTNLQDGIVMIQYSGTDANGFSFEGAVSSRLAEREK